MNARDQILSNIRKRTKIKGDGPPVSLFAQRNKDELRARSMEMGRGRARRSEELVETFKRECEQVLGKVHMARDQDEARQALTSLIKEAGIGRIIKWGAPILEGLEIDQFFDSLEVQDVLREKRKSPSNLEREAYLRLVSNAELGISGADFGLADTGTLVLRALPNQERAVSLLPPIHVAILDSRRILNSSDDLIDRLKLELEENGRLDSCVTLITGPSKTADIELSLILGVHGPKALHVIIIHST